MCQPGRWEINLGYRLVVVVAALNQLANFNGLMVSVISQANTVENSKYYLFQLLCCFFLLYKY